ncbi:hypothetical protein PISMIDRAFT_13452 [Pisolithus microcarpus 441]|uniref:Uncharacterized protein n=1 Tax=Pisolithus microcarpus 441 TaxID=765257 RepID=A0A0C9Z0A1_9AGAM|nr:hypothetical protein PISMIDRAFT_13452 [Pisolithus microcarpus 441]
MVESRVPWGGGVGFTEGSSTPATAAWFGFVVIDIIAQNDAQPLARSDFVHLGAVKHRRAARREEVKRATTEVRLVQMPPDVSGVRSGEFLPKRI